MQGKKRHLIYSNLLAYIVLSIGIVLQIIVYLQNRSLRLDEANVAQNIAERSYAGLFESLDHGQLAPPFYLCWVKGCTQLLGMHELALRLPSLIGGMMALLLFFALLRELKIKLPLLIYFLFLFIFSEELIRYSSELKQYILDVAWVELFLLWALKIKSGINNWRQGLLWSLAGVVGIWFSMPIVFMLAPIGLIFLWKAWKTSRMDVLRVMAVGGSWVLSFSLYFFLLLYQDSKDALLQNYHQYYYFNFFTMEAAAWRQNLALIEQLFRLVYDQTVISILWGVLSFLGGMILLIRNHKKLALLLLMPIAVCFLASNFELYSLANRLVLFLIPLFILTSAVTLNYLWKKSANWLKFLLLIPMLLSIGNQYGYRYFWQKLELEDAKAVMHYLEEHRKEEDLIYVQWEGQAAFQFYNEHYANAWKFENYIISQDWQEIPVERLANLMEKGNRCWLFYTHTFPPEMVKKEQEAIKTKATQLDQFEAAQAYLYFYEWRD